MSWKRVVRGTKTWNLYMRNKKLYKKYRTPRYWWECQYYDGHVEVFKCKASWRHAEKKVKTIYTKAQPLSYGTVRIAYSNKGKPRIPWVYRIQNILISFGFLKHTWKHTEYNSIK